MTIKRAILSLLTVVVILFTGSSLWASWQQPQIQSRLELYQTNLLLRAGQLQSDAGSDANLTQASKTLVGEEPLVAATKQYQDARELAQKNLAKAQNQLRELAQQPSTTPAPPKPQEQIAPITNTSRTGQQKQLQTSLNQIKKLIAELDLRLGILQAQQKQTQSALTSWQNVLDESPQTALANTANVLIGLWSNPPRLFPDAERLIQENLDGWFQGRAFTQLYQTQQRPDALQTLQAVEQEQAQQAVLKLAIISSIPAIAGLTGLGLLVYLIFGRLTKGKEALIAQNGELAWSTPWDWETVWQVFIVGFFLMGQIVIPLLFALVPKPTVINARVQALSTLATYLLLAAGAISVLYFSIQRYLPLPSGWFRFKLRENWFLWGVGGYCAALPLVVIVSLINQRIWQGQGGSNPLLSLVLEGQDRVALSIFFFTAAIAAPLFEEFLFRGFLLPSLTRYFSVWQAILLSAFLFAVAHLSLSEILPLTVLGVVLGVVYTRSRNLLAPMLLHSLWNSGTLISLFILGSSST